LSRRKKRTRKVPKKDPNYYINILAILFFLALIGILIKIFIFDSFTKEEISKIVLVATEQKQSLSKEYSLGHEEKGKTSEVKDVNREKSSSDLKYNNEKKDDFLNSGVIQKTTTNKIVESKNQIIKNKEKQKTSSNGIGKLVIIIDDITTEKQLSKIEQIGYPVTISFLPPTNLHKNSANIAQGLAIYMVHLPLEATSKIVEESDTLHVGDTLEVIESRIKELKKLYPKAIYYNNHTGSKFTENGESMDALMKVIKSNNLIFVDSKTSSKSVVEKYALKYEMRYISRDIFLDNIPSKESIRKQLKKAVSIAQSTGKAIAIGHPYDVTFQTLRDSKDILEGVEIVFIDKI
jgi:polysaccharide deacetylase 2 family uncharacterized protein YibQ